jgi:hypothetical protein
MSTHERIDLAERTRHRPHASTAEQRKVPKHLIAEAVHEREQRRRRRARRHDHAPQQQSQRVGLGKQLSLGAVYRRDRVGIAALGQLGPRGGGHALAPVRTLVDLLVCARTSRVYAHTAIAVSRTDECDELLRVECHTSVAARCNKRHTTHAFCVHTCTWC